MGYIEKNSYQSGKTIKKAENFVTSGTLSPLKVVFSPMFLVSNSSHRCAGPSKSIYWWIGWVIWTGIHISVKKSLKKQRIL